MDATAETVAGMAYGTPGPFTIGVYGTWGSGKTTVLENAKSLLEENPDVISVLLNPWKHERSDEPADALLAEFDEALAPFEVDTNRSWSKRLRKGIGAIRRKMAPANLTKALGLVSKMSAAPAAAHSPQLATALLGLSKAADVSSQLLEGAKPTEEDDSDESDLAIPEGKRVIVFIDDLDRCRPESTLEVLEAIKHLLWREGMIFVVAIDNVVIEQALKFRYQAMMGSTETEFSTRYLEKLIQTSVPIEHREAELFAEFTRRLVRSAIHINRAWLPEKIEESGVPELLAQAAHRVPRQVKRLVNNVLSDWAQYRSAERGNFTIDDAAGVALCRVVHELDRENFELVVLAREDTHMRFVAGLEDGKLESEESKYWGELGILNSVKHESFRPWFANRKQRQRWSRFTSSTGEIQRLLRTSIEVQAKIADEAIKLYRSKASMLVFPSDTNDIGFEIALNALPSTILDIELSGTRITDQGLAQLKDRSVRSLVAFRTAISDDSARILASLKTLESLSLGETAISDRTIAALNDLQNLRELFLAETNITDNSIHSICALEKLRLLHITGTKISKDGFERLKQALPACQMYY